MWAGASLTDLIASLTAPLLIFGAQAAQPPVYPVPQEVPYAAEVSSQLSQRPFSTDVGRVAAFEFEPAEHSQTKLEVFIHNRKTCADAGYRLTYRIVARNAGEATASNIVVQNQYPAGTLVENDVSPGATIDEPARQITWSAPDLPPGAFVDFTFTVLVQAPGRLGDFVRVDYQDAGAVTPDDPTFTVETDHFIYGSCSAPPAGVDEESDKFTLVVLPDTQKYARFNPGIFTRQTEWIKSRAKPDDLNIPFVVHVGDITDKNTRAEWEAAQTAMRILDGIVPYSLAAGNHEMGPPGFESSAQTRDTRLFNEYFPVDYYRREAWFGGVFEPGKMDNNYHFFRAGKIEWLVISLEFGPRDAVLEWANEIVRTHPNQRVIVATHSYLTQDGQLADGNIEGYGIADDPGGANDGKDIWEKFVRRHKNIVFVVSGHVGGDGVDRLEQTGTFGNTVYAMVANYQDQANGGNGNLRLLEIDPPKKEVKVKTFSTETGGFVSDDQNQFEFTDVDFGRPDPTWTLPAVNKAVPPSGPIPTGKQAPIICHPAEIGCVGVLPTLGFNFGQALNPVNQVVICDPTSGLNCTPNRPTLGVRFAEAIADIEPGDCRVIGDDIINTPDYQDALLRRASPAALYLRPLYNSGKDFERLVHENALLGIGHLRAVEETLRPIFFQAWQRQREAIENVLAGRMSAAQARALIPQWDEDWERETQAAQGALARLYAEMQQIRRGKFDPVATEAVSNAIQSLRRACGGLDRDGGVGALLPFVRQAYSTSLDGRGQAYPETQEKFVGEDVFEGSRDWMIDLAAALTAFEQGDRVPLETYLSTLGDRADDGWRQGWEATYEKHAQDDEAADREIWKTRWEVMLDNPKAEATQCAAENQFPAPSQATWCESNSYAEFLIRGAPQPAKVTVPGASIAPPSSIEGTTAINQALVEGIACGGRPGDPHWDTNCTCQCGELVPLGDGNFQSCVDYIGGIQNITLHDIAITSQEECLLQIGELKHDHFNPGDD